MNRYRVYFPRQEGVGMIRFSQGVFVRRAGEQSILWRPQTGTCLILDGAEPFLRHIGRTGKIFQKTLSDSGIGGEYGVGGMSLRPRKAPT